MTRPGDDTARHVMIRRGTVLVGRLQRSQLSVQASTRSASIAVFLLASWADHGHVALVAFQGALLAVPYTLIEALVGRPQSAEVVPVGWDRQAWATRVAAVVTLPVAVVGVAAVSVALPQSSVADRLLVVAPVLLQLPLEALFWSMAADRGRRRANLVPQLVAAGTIGTAVVFFAVGARLEIAAVPGQLAVLAWALGTRRRAPGRTRPGLLAGLRPGLTYCLAAAVDLGYVVALPAVAAVVAGPAAIVVLRAMDLAFGPFHVALAATTREDLVAGRAARLRTGTRLLTVVLLAGVSGVLLASAGVRGLLAAELAAAGLVPVALYGAYKAAVMVSTWLSVRHMVRAAPRTFLVSAVGSRTIAVVGLVAALLWVDAVGGLFGLLALGETLVALWYAVRLAVTTAPPPTAPAGEIVRPRDPSTTLVTSRQPQETS
ncbi:hypothetical protein O7623_30420 [Solwaraspora sp. WMMD791]|uniref:hypothetical protein n=1 Tax=Solwaraspora sp. WMMD791 TaxID=3016086 RepID=UPI00249CC166|nr:hypothetical protein [Solwaraspora sp. WMMD791]WFE27484.1 hypothetical protein O7623_30420 [Solwaraspora sp. WMMD791]